jgi:GTP-binding protein HflX
VSTAVDKARADLGIADGGPSLRQGRLLEDKVGVRDVDRTALILGVPAEHARSSEGRLHVRAPRSPTSYPPTTPGRGLSRAGDGRVGSIRLIGGPRDQRSGQGNRWG